MNIVRKSIISLIINIFIVSALFAKSDINYEIDITDTSLDIFKVTVNLNGFNQDSYKFNFPSVVPGTYEHQDFGRFVLEFKAYDREGNELFTDKLNTNSWYIENTKHQFVSQITYIVEDTWDSTIDEKIVSPMIGTSIDS